MLRDYLLRVRSLLGTVVAAAPEQRETPSSFARYLRGDGVEIGALGSPVDLSAAADVTRVRYVDRFTEREMEELFPEVRDAGGVFVEPDILCDITMGLSPLEDDSQDFVITSQVIEHLPDPLFFLEEIWRVLRPGGRCYLGLPDKDFLAYDGKRPLTTLAHVIDDRRRRVRAVEDHHLIEFLEIAENMCIPADPAVREALFERQRLRSIHVHIWNTAAFCELLAYFISQVLPFKVVAVSTPAYNERSEQLYLLEKCGRESWPQIMIGIARLKSLSR